MGEGKRVITNVPSKSLVLFTLWPESSAQSVGKEQFLVCIVYEDDMHYGKIDLPNCNDGERNCLDVTRTVDGGAGVDKLQAFVQSIITAMSPKSFSYGQPGCLNTLGKT